MSRKGIFIVAMFVLLAIASAVWSYFHYNQERSGGTNINPFPTAPPSPAPASRMEMEIKVAFLNPDGELPNEAKPGDLTGCDHVVFSTYAIVPTTTPLAAALNLLLGNKEIYPGEQSQPYHVYNYVAKGNLKLAAAIVKDGVATISLTGTPPPLGGVCDDPRLLIQVTQTARQFPTVQKVKLLVNGVENTGSGNEKGE